MLYNSLQLTELLNRPEDLNKSLSGSDSSLAVFPLHLATLAKKFGFVRMFLAAGALPEPLNRHDRTPLHIAADAMPYCPSSSAIGLLLLAASPDPRAAVRLRSREGSKPRHVIDILCNGKSPTPFTAMSELVEGDAMIQDRVLARVREVTQRLVSVEREEELPPVGADPTHLGLGCRMFRRPDGGFPYLLVASGPDARAAALYIATHLATVRESGTPLPVRVASAGMVASIDGVTEEDLDNLQSLPAARSLHGRPLATFSQTLNGPTPTVQRTIFFPSPLIPSQLQVLSAHPGVIHLARRFGLTTSPPQVLLHPSDVKLKSNERFWGAPGKKFPDAVVLSGTTDVVSEFAERCQEKFRTPGRAG